MEPTIEEIKNIISNNQRDIAFLIGNGINNYAGINRLNGEKPLSWKELLKRIGGIDFKDYQKGENVKEGISYTEIFDALESHNLKERIKQENPGNNTERSIDGFSVLFANELKQKVCNEVKYWELEDKVSNMLQSIRRRNAPILTTNFDLSISKKMDDLFPYEMKYQVFGRGKGSEVYPWSYYYGDDYLYNPCNDFGIWHLQGIATKPQSLCLGLSDYIRIAKKAWGLIHNEKMFETDTFEGKNTNNWKGYRTWLHILFNKSLFVFGLQLEENETFLRWLLIQRAKYYALFNERSHKGWYVYPKKEEGNAGFYGKKVFLEKVGFEMLPVDSYKVIYEDLWN